MVINVKKDENMGTIIGWFFERLSEALGDLLWDRLNWSKRIMLIIVICIIAFLVAFLPLYIHSS